MIKINNVSLNFPLTSRVVVEDTDRIDYKNRIIKGLDNISLEISNGERVGLYGSNGSGKSSLLRLMSGIYRPTKGNIIIDGKVVQMIDIMAGMDFEFSGMINIKLRLSLLGCKFRDEKIIYEKIVSESGLGEFIHLPMKIYSTGMQMRLAFAIVTNVTSDILIMDEWLSVGDQAFKDEAERKLKNLVQGVKILVIASHSIDLLRSICNRIIFIEGGRIVAEETI